MTSDARIDASGTGPASGAAAVGSAMPSGLPEAERVAWYALSPSKRAKVIRRIHAIETWTSKDEAEMPLIDEVAAAAGLAPSSFYALLAAWREAPSLAALGVRVGEKSKRPSSRAVAAESAIRRLISVLLRSDSSITTSEVLRAVRESHPDGAPSETTLIRWLQDERNRARRTGVFGEQLAFDAAALSVTDVEGEQQWLYMIADVGTGLVLGSAVSGLGLLSAGYAAAALPSFERLGAFDLDNMRVHDGEPSISASLDADDAEGFSLFVSLTRDVHLSSAERDLGRTVTGVLGDRLGPYRLSVGRPREARDQRSGRRLALPVVEGDFAQIISTQLDAWNDMRRGELECEAPTRAPRVARSNYERVLTRLSERF